MSNYLPEIENEYSRGRGRPSLLSPLDWNLAQSWEDAGIPLHIVLGAMAEAFKNFAAQKRKDSINSLRYFTQEVEKKFADWKTSQVGKSPEANKEMKDECFTAYASCDHTDVLEYLIERFERVIKTGSLPQPLAAAAEETRRVLSQLTGEAIAVFS